MNAPCWVLTGSAALAAALGLLIGVSALRQDPLAAHEQFRKELSAALYYMTLAALNLALLAVALAVGP